MAEGFNLFKDVKDIFQGIKKGATLAKQLYKKYQREGGFPNGLRKLPAREEAPAAGACPFPFPALPALPWRPPAPTGGLGEKIGAPPPLGGFRPNAPRGGFPLIRRWWARVGSATPFSPPPSLLSAWPGSTYY